MKDEKRFEAMPKVYPGVEYDRAIELAKKASHWALLAQCESQEPEVWVAAARSAILTAAKHHDDAGASAIVPMLFRAVVDNVVHSRIEIRKPEFGHVPRPFIKQPRGEAPSAYRKIEDLADRAFRELAAEAMTLFATLPEKGAGQQRVIVAEDESYLAKCDTPTLLETKRLLLLAVGQRWDATKDEEEADVLFTFLRGVAHRFDEEKKVVLRVIKDSLTRVIPHARLARHLRTLVALIKKDDADKWWYGDLARELALGMGRHDTAPERIAADCRVMAPLFAGSPAALAYMERVSADLAAVDTQVQELVAKLQPPQRLLCSDSWVWGSISWEYSSLAAIRLSVDLTKSYRRDEEAHENFERAKSMIAAWKKERGSMLGIMLVMFAMHPYQIKRKAFSRDIQL